MAKDLSIPARDGYTLAATLYEGEPPSDGRSAPAAVISAATGTPRWFYEKFALYLAASGLSVITFDYRGIGGSRPPSLRGFGATMLDWGRLDLAGVIDFCEGYFPDRDLVVIGHSVGGQLFGLAENNDAARALLVVSSQSGELTLWRGFDWLVLASLYFGLMPTLPALFGYFPSRWIGLGENLPAGVARQWSRWARSRDYLVGALGEQAARSFANFRGSILSLSFADDRMAPRVACQRLLEFYRRAKTEHRHVEPSVANQSKIGHFGFFREKARETLWPAALQWLRKETSEPI